jgi:GNAT superfamily N-acetyltransferase
VEVHPATAERWPDLAAVFEEGGDARSCWCMWFRQSSEEYRAGSGAVNRAALEAIVRRGEEPGLLAYVDGEPAAWCAVQRRDELKRLDRSPVTKSLDGAEAWAVPCFVTRRKFRGRGLNAVLLEAAVRYAAGHGARLVEGFPVDSSAKVSASQGYHGFASTFVAAGFEEVARRKPARPYMRRAIQ